MRQQRNDTRNMAILMMLEASTTYEEVARIFRISWNTVFKIVKTERMYATRGTKGVRK